VALLLTLLAIIAGLRLLPGERRAAGKS
jgi:hypothetical protein